MPEVVVVGEMLVDLVLAPGTDVPLGAHLGGGPFTAARALGRLGVDVAFAGAISSDRFGCRGLAALTADGVRLDRVLRTDAPTTLAVAALDPAGAATYTFYTHGTSAPGLTEVDLRGTRAVHVGTLGLVLEPIGTTVEAAVAALPDDVTVLLDPNCRPSIITDPAPYRQRLTRLAARADVLKVSTEDLDWLAPGLDPMQAAGSLATRAGALVLVTAGADGVSLVQGDEVRHVPAAAVVVVDTVGAGDTFGAGFLAHRLQHPDADPIDAVRYGVLAAGIACSRPGADPPTADEVAAARL